MLSISSLSRSVRELFEQDAVELARAHGLRHRHLSAKQLALILVLGWWSHPSQGQSALSRFAAQVGVHVSKQAIDAHLTQRTANWLLALLQRSVQRLVCSTVVPVALLSRFKAVLIEDGSTISLPPSLQHIWQGCGGNTSRAAGPAKTEAALKITLRWDLVQGGLDGPHVQPGRQHDLRSVLSEHSLPAGSLYCADLGYWVLLRLAEWSRRGVLFVMRYKVGTIVWSEGKRVSLCELLPSQVNQTAERVVDLGATRQVRGVRLLMQKVPDDVVKARHERYYEYARVHGKPVNPLVLELAHWTLLVSNVPASQASLAELFAVQHARWQIELLFKLWKQQTLLDEWNGDKPMRVLCEVYAKLLGVLVQHWLLLLSSWQDPDRSWQVLAPLIREQIPVLLHGLLGRLPLRRAVRLMVQSVQGVGSIPARSTRPSTSRLLQGALAPGLT